MEPDKGNGEVVIDRTDYYESLDKLFSDTTKFKRLDADPTNVRLSVLQTYLRKLYNRNEISEEFYQEIRRRNAKIAKAHGLPKVYKSFERVPTFLIKSTLSKNILRKLILDTCQKTAFKFNNIYEHKDCVSMRASLGPVLANIIVTDCEKVIVDNLVRDGTIVLYSL